MTSRAGAAPPVIVVPERVGLLSPKRLRRVLLVVSAGTAIASFIYEIAWIRMLSFVLGSATHSFELMLSAFILGLALGAFWVRTRADRFADPMRTLGIVQWAMGTLAIATLPVYLMSFQWTLGILRTFGITEAGYQGFAVARYLICLAVMLPATFCAGITLPMITRMLITRSTGERAIGLVYGFNTFGSIVGAALAALKRAAAERALVIGVESDILFTISEQNAIASAFEAAGTATEFVPLASLEGHDAFLVDIEPFAAAISAFLSDKGLAE